MSKTELDAQVQIYFELMSQIADLQDYAESIKDNIKREMVEQTSEVLEGKGWRATWHNCNTSRFDLKKFKEDNSEMYHEYMQHGVSTRFTLRPVIN